MGFFDLLFGKSKMIEEPLVIENEYKYKQSWDSYLTSVNDEISSVTVDLGLNNIAPVINKINLVWISIKMNHPREDGLSSTEEYELLGEMEDALVDAIITKYNSIHTGRLTSAGHRNLYFYLEDTTFYDKRISDTMIAYPTYEYDFGTEDDKDWNCYFELLYPEPEQLRSIKNRRIIDNFKKQGDQLTKAREVDHWIFFKTELDRETFINKVKPDNFTIVDKDYDQTLRKYPNTLLIRRVDKVDQESVDKYVIYLWKLASECNGNYDRWTTSIE